MRPGLAAVAQALAHSAAARPSGPEPSGRVQVSVDASGGAHPEAPAPAAPKAVIVQFSEARPSETFPYIFAASLNGQHFAQFPGHEFRLYYGARPESSVPDLAPGSLVLVDGHPGLHEVVYDPGLGSYLVRAVGGGLPFEAPAAQVSKSLPTAQLRKEQRGTYPAAGPAGPGAGPTSTIPGPGGAELPVFWGKVAALRAAVQEFPDAGYFLYVDSDNIVAANSTAPLPAFYASLQSACGFAGSFVVPEDEGFWRLKCTRDLGYQNCGNGGAYLLQNTASSRAVLDDMWRRAPASPHAWPGDQALLAELANGTAPRVAVASPATNPACHLQCMLQLPAGVPAKKECLLHHYCDDKGRVEARAEARLGQSTAAALAWLLAHSAPLPPLPPLSEAA